MSQILLSCLLECLNLSADSVEKERFGFKLHAIRGSSSVELLLGSWRQKTGCLWFGQVDFDGGYV